MSGGGQMHFSGELPCPQFEANIFRKNFCQVCQGRIEKHDGASEKDVAAALEYSVDGGIVWFLESYKDILFLGTFQGVQGNSSCNKWQDKIGINI